jgi:protein TonB
MRLEAKALQMSLVVHALLVVLIMISSKDTLNAQKVVVIDLTLIDHVTANAGSSMDKKAKDPKSVAKKITPFVAQKREEVKKEKKQTQVERAEDDKRQGEEQVPPVETVSLEHESEQNSVSEDHEKDESTGIFFAHAQTTGVSTPSERGEPGINKTQNLGKGSGNFDGVMKGYLKSNLAYIKEMIQKNIAYPNIARRNGWTGKVTVSFIIAYNGRVRDVEVVRSSGFGCLDRNAVKAVERSSPFPHPPLEARIIIPVHYELH